MPICNDHRTGSDGCRWRCTLPTGHDGPHLAGNLTHEEDPTQGYIYRGWQEGGEPFRVDCDLADAEEIIREQTRGESTMPSRMTRSHFDSIAATLKSQRPDPKSATVGEKRVFGQIVRALADMAQNENYRFDRERFLRASGLDGEGL